ncbi:MAG: hypothetical protein ABL309_01780 [Phycisphaerales bacterium]
MKLSPDEPCRVLASGIDTLVLAIDVRWVRKDFIGMIDELKLHAKMDHEDQPGQLAPVDEPDNPWHFLVKPHGKNGYAWLLNSKEFALRIGDWTEPGAKPSIMANIRSESLWHLSPRGCIARIRALLEGAGAEIDIVKASRADLCCDALLPEADFTEELKSRLVTRAHLIDNHEHRGVFTGLSIGKSRMSARLYDKPIEIACKSGKVWMYSIWGLPDGIPEGHRIVRTEFQARREALKSLGINTVDDLFEKEGGLWKYATEKWLRVTDNPKLHHTQQTVLAWWRMISDGYKGAQGASPLVRSTSIKTDMNRLARLFYGTVSSMAAIQTLEDQTPDDESLDFDSFLAMAADLVRVRTDMSDIEFTRRVKRKRAKYNRAKSPSDGAFKKPDVS